MSVKIIRRGNSIFPKKITCLECGSLLEIEGVSDINLFDEDLSVSLPGVKCPVCGKRVLLHEADRDQTLLVLERYGEWR